MGRGSLIDIRRRAAMRLARKAGLLIKGKVGKVRKVSYKGAINLVTDIDKAAESLIIRGVKADFPDDSILSEEIGSREEKGAFRWIIDPLDGTTNFFRSFPFFSVSIGVEDEKGIALGVIYDPLRDELFHAVRDRGAYLNNKRIRVSGIKNISQGFLATGFSYTRARHNDNIDNFRKFLKNAFAIRRAGSAALDMAYVACGRFDGYWEIDIHPWDVAAGHIIVEEAGGEVTRFDGSRFNYLHKDILASNPFIHASMSRILKRPA